MPPGSQGGLRETLRDQGYFLACQAVPTEDLRLRGSAGPEWRTTVIEERELLSESVLRLRLRTPKEWHYHPGQYLELRCPAGVRGPSDAPAARSYSIASLPADGTLELHVRAVPHGLVSVWLHAQPAGTELSIRGPFGQCYYLPDPEDRDLLLVGTGTGLAPLLGIARDAAKQGHRGSIRLIHGGVDPTGLYLRSELETLASPLENWHLHFCVLRDAGANELEGALDQVTLELAGDLSKKRAFLCGDEAIVRTLRRTLFLHGLPSSEIFADPFTMSAPAGAVATS